MNDPMKLLKADHREVEQLLKTLADTDEGEERERLVDELQLKLALHMEIEEQLVYPAVAQYVGGEDEEEAEIEHGLAREGVERLVAMVSAPGFGAVVDMVQAGITHHVKEEENEILPTLKDALPSDAWAAMGDTIVERKEAAGMPPPPAPRRKSTKRRPKTATSSKASANSKK